MGNCNRKPKHRGLSNEAQRASQRRLSLIQENRLKSSARPDVSENVYDDTKSEISSITMVTMENVNQQEINEEEQYLGELDLQLSFAALMELEATKISQEAERKQAIDKVGQKGLDLNLVAKELKNDKDVVLIAVTNNGLALQYASETLKADKEIVLAAIKNHAAALEYASTILKSDVEIVETALKCNGRALLHCSDSLKANVEIVTIAITTNGSALEYATEEIRRDKKMVLLAVENNPSSLKYAMDGLNEDKDCLHAAGLVETKSCMS